MTDPPPTSPSAAAVEDETADWRDGYERAPARVRIGIGAVVVIVILGLTVAVIVGLSRGAASVERVEIAETTAIEAPEVYVHVRGAVESPGLHRLNPGARVVDAIAAAGGFSDDADDGALNLARAVTDGEQLSVPVAGEGAAADNTAAGGVPGVAPDGRVNLNTADQALLETLPRIGPALAQRIIAWRDEHGGFSSIEQLTQVSGIGERVLEELRSSVTT